MPRRHPLHAPAAARRPLRPAATALSIQLPLPGGCAFVRNCACTVGFVTHHGGRPRWQRVKDDDGGDEFGVCGVQPVPCPVMCTAPSRATTPPPPSTRRHHPLHAATTLYTPLPLPSPCHPRCPYVPLPVSPLAAASTCGAALVRGFRACTMHSPGPSGRTLLSHTSHPRPHVSHGPTRHPSAPPVSRPRPWPHPRPCPTLGPHRVRPRLPGPIRGHAPRLGPHRVRPRLPGPIHGCAPHLSPCRVRPRLLGPICGHAMRSRDRVRVTFMCHWVAHTHRESMGDCTYTLDTVYEHV